MLNYRLTRTTVRPAAGRSGPSVREGQLEAEVADLTQASTDRASRQTAGRLATVMAKVQEEIFGRLGPEERSTLLRLLERVA